MLQIHLDHFVLGIKNLEQGMTEFAEKTGIEPVFGGIHEKIGTHNALVSLGEGTYLEILAPREPQGISNSIFGDLSKEKLTPVGWVLGVSDSRELTELMESYDIPHSGMMPLSRKTSEDKEIKWTNVFHLRQGFYSANPFFIEWEDCSVHPSITSPEGCTLQNFTISSHENDPITHFLKSFSFDFLSSDTQNTPGGWLIQLRLNTPKGTIEFN